MSDEIDPEVLADLRLRDASERDTTRTRGRGIYDAKPDLIVGAWPCRNPRCTAHVPVTQEAYDQIEVCNRQLAKVGEEPQIATGDVMFCERCTVEFKRTAADRRRAQIDRMAHVIRQLKAGETRIEIRDKHGVRFVDEREAFKQLKDWSHPDVEGFRQALTDRLNKQRGRGGNL